MLCRYERTIFQSKNGYCIFSYATTDQSVPEAARSKRNYRDSKIRFTAVGYGLPATETVEADLTGTWQKSSYGLQLQVEHFEESLPTDTVGIIAYLSSGCIKGVGPNIAKAIVARFGAKTMEVIEKDPDQLLSVKGIAKAKLEKIKSSYQETAKLRGLTQYLAPYGVSMKKIAKTYEEFGDQSLSIVRKGNSFCGCWTIRNTMKTRGTSCEIVQNPRWQLLCGLEVLILMTCRLNLLSRS